MKTMDPRNLTEEEKEEIWQGLNSETKSEPEKSEKDIILNLKETINLICDRVRNKLVAPYTAIQLMDKGKLSKDFVDMSMEDIHWLCHVYFPKIINDVDKLTRAV